LEEAPLGSGTLRQVGRHQERDLAGPVARRSYAADRHRSLPWRRRTSVDVDRLPLLQRDDRALAPGGDRGLPAASPGLARADVGANRLDVDVEDGLDRRAD